ncbi:unnamed protein product [Microthlaspi erraticum]|uniref:Uncharacterized protein n=1 Tax=Microthlaspi erraticum TaxID=1685480 RepID=A0A6D2IU14_9BRAS|nr:unnamed protein product [Microthlaspi erraticum]
MESTNLGYSGVKASRSKASNQYLGISSTWYFESEATGFPEIRRRMAANLSISAEMVVVVPVSNRGEFIVVEKAKSVFRLIAKWVLFC